MEYLSHGVRCIGDTCYVVGSAIGRTAVKGVASLPVGTRRSNYKNMARRAIAALSPEATRFYREAHIQGATEEDGRIDRDAIRSMGFFERDYPFPGGPMGIDEVGRAFDELRGHRLIHFPGRNRNGFHRFNRPYMSLSGMVGNWAEGARQLERSWGVREPNAPLFPNAVNGNRRRNPYQYRPPPAPVAAPVAAAAPVANEEPALFNVPRQNIYGSPNFVDVLTFNPIPEGNEVIRIRDRPGSNPNIATYGIPQLNQQRLDFLRGLNRTRTNIVTVTPFTPDQIQRGPYRYRPAVAAPVAAPAPADGDPEPVADQGQDQGQDQDQDPEPVSNTRRRKTRVNRKNRSIRKNRNTRKHKRSRTSRNNRTSRRRQNHRK